MKKIALSAMAILLCVSAMAQQEKKAYMVSNAHFDTQWNWDVQTSIREYVKNTITQNLFLLERYPNYVFNFEGGVKYWWMKEYYPEEYRKVKNYIANGRWHLTGSSWDANEVVVSNPTSLLRNILLGQTYYRQEFGKEGTDIFLPDCFGFPYTLPTVAAHCGLIGFSSQKLYWRQNPFYSGGRKYPFQFGVWQGVDGSRIGFAHAYDYNTKYYDEDISSNEELVKLTGDDLGMVMHYYGVGDIGGSPTVESVRSIEKGLKGNGPVKIISATSDQAFKDYPLASHPELPIFDGELLMDVHGSGVYTSQAAMKLYNRQNETLGDAAERAAVTAETYAGEVYPLADMTANWRRIIWHQFHDDLPGTCIPRAYEFSWNDELIGLKKFSDVIANSVKAVAAGMDTRVKGTPVVVYNALGFSNPDMVEVSVPSASAPAKVSVVDASGKKAKAQLLGWKDGVAKVLVNAAVPGVGFSVYGVSLSGKGKQAAQEKKDVRTLENSVYLIGLDENGDIISLIDKRSNTQLVADGKAIRLAIIRGNGAGWWPAWEILKSTVDKESEGINGNVSITLVEDGALRKSICIEKSCGDSRFRQYIRLYEGNRADRIDFYNEVDWATLDALVKMEFPLSVSNPNATYDLGLGSIQRGNNVPTAYEVPSHNWTDLTASDGSYGVTVLNNSKYGWDKPSDNTIRLTLFHSPKPNQSFTYQDRQDFGHHEFCFSLIGHKGALVKADAVRAGEKFNQELKAFATAPHAGKLGKQISMLSCDNPNVLIAGFKKAEVSDEYALTVFEMGGKAQKATIRFGKPVVAAVEADGTEKTKGAAAFAGNTLSVDITPYSIRTYKVRLGGAEPAKVKSASVELPYNMKVCSFNQFRKDANFSGGNSYAAELFPEKLLVDGIPFEFGDKETKTGLQCKGAQTIDLPEGQWNRVYLLAASRGKDLSGVKIGCGSAETLADVPSYTGFIGQWGHTGQTTGFLKDAEIAFLGSHKHSTKGDVPYEFTYMFKLAVDVPAGANSIVLPDNEDLVIFSATAVNDPRPEAIPASRLYITSIQ